MINRFINIYKTVCLETLDRDIFPFYLAPSYLLTPFSSKIRQRSKQSIGDKCLNVAAKLGPLFIKLGQFLSTRPDILPAEITQKLSELQDNVAPIPIETIQTIMKETYGPHYSKTFLQFSKKPIASASIAQVHTAMLSDGSEIVIKIRRPQLDTIIANDLSALKKLARIVNSLTHKAKPLRLLDLIHELSLSLNQEIHLLNEAGHYAQMKQNFKGHDDVHIPDIHWDYCHNNAIVIERIHGLGIAQVEKLRQSSVDLKYLAKKGIEIFFTQLVKYRYFHADMHPGNIFIDVSNPKKPRYIPIDFGIMGYLSEDDSYYITQNLHAFLQRDFRKIAELHIESEWVPRETRLFDLEASVRGVCAPLLDKPLGDISFAQVLHNLLIIGKQYNMVIQPQLILLQKTLFSVEGIGRRLCPDINVWEIARPFMQEIERTPTIKQRWDYVQRKLPKWLESFRPQPQQPYVPVAKIHITPKIICMLTLSLGAFMLEQELVALAIVVGFSLAL